MTSSTAYRMSEGLNDHIESIGAPPTGHATGHATGRLVSYDPAVGVKFSVDYQPLSAANLSSLAYTHTQLPQAGSVIASPGDSTRARAGSVEQDSASEPFLEAYTAMRGPSSSKDITDRKFSGGDTDDGYQASPISPNTFRELAQGYVRWDAGQVRDYQNVLATAIRLRPDGPGPLDEDHFPYYLTNPVRQFDAKTGEEISPLYDVPTDPSIIYTPPGVDEGAHITKEFRDKYCRMAPLAAEGLRHLEAEMAEADAGDSPAGTDERYTNEDVDQIITDDHAPGFSPGAQYEQFLASHHQQALDQEAWNDKISQEIAEKREHADTLQYELGKLLAYCDIVREERAHALRKGKARLDNEAAMPIADRDQRDERIQHHVRGTMRDVEEQLRRAHARGDKYQEQASAYDKKISRLEIDIMEQCLILGHTSPEEVYGEVQKFSKLAKEQPQQTKEQQPKQHHHNSDDDEDKNSEHHQSDGCYHASDALSLGWW
ncbi:hypothetical protein Hte_003482 [Hypoxylon texense]